MNIGKYRKRSTLIVLILAGETIFFLPFLVARIFRPTLLAEFDLTNTQLGLLFSVYGIVAMISYVLGGPLADRYPARKLMAIALWTTAVGGLMMLSIPGFNGMLLIYGLWGASTILLFWAAMLRVTREWGGDQFQGRAYGWLEGGRGGVAALLGTISLFVFNRSETNFDTVPGNNTLIPIQWVILTISLITIIVGILVYFIIPDNRETLQRDPAVKVLVNIGKLLRLPTIWALMLLIITAYSGYKITDDFSLYANEVLGFSEANAAAVGTSALWLRAIVAISVGILADRWVKVDLIIILFGISALFALFPGLGILASVVPLTLLNIVFLASGIYGIRALYFSVQKEARIPFALTGTAIGLISFMGYTPDIFMGPVMGYLLDNFPGEKGHQFVFLLLSATSLTGLFTALVFKRLQFTN